MKADRTSNAPPHPALSPFGSEVRTEEELRRAFDRMLGEDGPFVVCVKVSKGRAEGRLDRDVVGHARRFAHALAALPAT
jgi:hypothetical protein